MFYTNRPKIKVPFTTLDLCIELLSIALLVFMWAYLIMHFGELPDKVPSHYNAAGEADSYSGRGFVFFIPIIATGLYAFLLLLTRYPHLNNYMVNITEDNAYKQYRFSVYVLRVVNLLCVIMFLYINHHIIQGAINQHSELGKGFLITVFGMSIVIPIAIIFYQNRLK